ncbi:hypothetical protein WJX84_011135 [Apatococcus fuscideae]|uniref:F-box domain-containing protein n=1 Tax=Apatococcus fuscideae TaxID=2026836 RepID=A0AAW1TEZ3_9CHLO
MARCSKNQIPDINAALFSEDVLRVLLGRLTCYEATRLAATCSALLHLVEQFRKQKGVHKPRMIVCSSRNNKLVELDWFTAETLHTGSISPSFSRASSRGRWSTGIALSPYDHDLYVCQYGSKADGIAQLHGRSLRYKRMFARSIKAPEGIVIAHYSVYVMSAEGYLTRLSLDGQQLSCTPLCLERPGAPALVPWGLALGPDNILYTSVDHSYESRSYTEPPRAEGSSDIARHGSVMQVRLTATGGVAGEPQHLTCGGLVRPSGLCFTEDAVLLVTSMDGKIYQFALTGPHVLCQELQLDCPLRTLAAAAAASTFQRVLVLDKDKLETSVEILKQPSLRFDTICEEARRHRSVPQGLQVHALLPGGGGTIEKLLPGFYEQCSRSGAVCTAADFDVGKQIRMSFGTQQMTAVRVPEGYRLLLATRMLFERCARARLLEQYPNVQFCSSCKVAEILYDDSRRSVKGVRLASGEEILAAFVVDTSGGRSQAVINFIQDKSGEKVETVKYDVGLSYYTRFFKVPDRELRLPERDRMHITMCAPRAPVSDGGMVFRMEGDMYQALVSRMNKEKCGPSLDDFLGMLKSLPDLDSYNVLQGAEPIGPSIDYLGAQGTQRQFYERIQNWPEN